uniref:Uncharacterized protein n=1 Tax=Rhizophora mucronata TaxID=61149 RepID=A0A2P2PH33_RHIMU
MQSQLQDWDCIFLFFSFLLRLLSAARLTISVFWLI